MSEVADFYDERAKRKGLPTVPRAMADIIILQQLFGAVIELQLIAMYLSETDRIANGAIIHAQAIDLLNTAERLQRNANEIKA